MPEIPDIETFRRYAGSTCLHKDIKDVKILDARVTNVSESRLRDTLTGKSFESADRRGKWMFLNFAGGALALHFGMTGRIAYYKKNGSEPDYPRMRIHFENGYRLDFDCQRKLGQVDLTKDQESFIEKKHLGPDALSLDREGFIERVSGKRGSIKSAFMDQSLLSGIGNVYSDEILFQTGIHPRETVKSLDHDDLSALFDAMRDVLSVSIDNQADPDRFPAHFLIRARKEGEPCPREDGGRIKTVKISNRTSYYCSKHQKAS